MASEMPDLRLPSQPQIVTVLWPEPNCTAANRGRCRVQMTCPESLHENGLATSQTHNPMITSQTFEGQSYHVTLLAGRHEQHSAC